LLNECNNIAQGFVEPRSIAVIYGTTTFKFYGLIKLRLFIQFGLFSLPRNKLVQVHLEDPLKELLMSLWANPPWEQVRGLQTDESHLPLLCVLGDSFEFYSLDVYQTLQVFPSVLQNFSVEERSTDVCHTKKDTQLLKSIGDLRATYQAQLGYELRSVDYVSSFLKDLGVFGNVPISDTLIREVEGLVALFITIQGCSDYVSVCSACFLYFQRFYTQSITRQLMEYIQQLFDTQSGEEVEGVETNPDWLSLMRNVQYDWTLVRGNRFFTEFSKLLGLLVTSQLCHVSDVTFNIGNYRLIEPDMKIVHANAIDLADATLSTVVYFVENIYESYKTGSLKPFLINDKTAAEIDNEYANMLLWWSLVQNGNLQKVAGVSESEFDRRLEIVTTRFKNLLGTKQNFEKKLIDDKYMKLLTIRNDYITLKISSGVRRAPFAIELFGESSQGKTTLGDQLVDALLRSANLPLGKEYRASYNPGDKYMSNWATNKLVMFIDDMANDKSSFVERPPTRVIIDVCNNQPYYANMADLSSKGKVFVEPSIVVVNTNIKDLDAYVYSNCPHSIQRRMHAVIEVRAKKEFQFIVDGQSQGIDSSKIRAKYKETGVEPTFDDIWLLTVTKARKPRNLYEIATYTPVSFRGSELVDVSFSIVLQYLIELYSEHRENQDDIICRMGTRNKTLEICPHEGCVQMSGYCDLHDHLYNEKQMGAEFGDTIIESTSRAVGVVTERVSNDLFGSSSAVEGVVSLGLLTSAKIFARHWDWLSIVPKSWVENEKFQTCLMCCDSPKLVRNYWRRTLITWGLAGSCVGLSAWKSSRTVTIGLFGSLFTLCGMNQCFMASSVQNAYRKELLDRNVISPSLQYWRDKHAPDLWRAAGVLGSLYAIARLYRRWASYKAQGSLEPICEEDIVKRDAEENIWTTVSKRKLPMTMYSKCISPLELSAVVDKNLVYGTAVGGDQKLMVNGLFLCSNVVVIPDHYFAEHDVLSVTFRKENPDDAGGKFVSILSRDAGYHIPDTDFRVCYSSTGGSFRDLTRWFPTTNMPDHQFTMLWREKSGQMIVAGGLAKPGEVSNTASKFIGGTYANLSINTFKGLCGAVLVSHGKGSCISGIHLGGRSGTRAGCYGTLTKDQVTTAIDMVREIEGVLVSGSAEIFENQSYGINLLSDRPLHPKSPLNYMPQNSQVEYYGSCDGMVSSYSSVRVTPISDIVTDVTGVPNIWGPPKMKPEWFGWQMCLANLANPALPYEHSLLTRAIIDYKSSGMEIFRREYNRGVSPLDDQANLNGIPGKKFVDAIKLDTSMGYPLIGPKRNFVLEGEEPGNRVFKPEVLQEIDRCYQHYLKGERAYTIAKGCKKDEILSKEKCRIFYGNPIALTFLIRRYYLPIIRVMQMHPLTFECAVGINSHGPEWQEFHDFVYKFGASRLIGGDYGKYDQKIPSQLLFASLRILIDFAAVCNYTSEDMRIMEAMAGDIVYAVIAFNGDLIGLTEGTHISGNSLTVILNGICGSLNMRCAYYESRKECVPFRDVVALMTYGDDNIGSVHESVTDFNISTISSFLGKYGQIYTMPDKESEIVPFLPPQEFEFLKRKSVYCPKKGVVVGALLEKSIFKMLHCYLRPKGSPNTPELACAINIDTALREWANHGEFRYDQRRFDMKVVAREVGISHLCTMLDVTYDDLVLEWKGKYCDGHEVFSLSQADYLFEC
jgi:hypothetical protein